MTNFRNSFGYNEQIGVFNCLQMIGCARDGNLSGENFSSLDMRMCSLVGKDLQMVNFKGARFNRAVFFAQGHSGWVESVDFSPNGKYIASASADRKIKFGILKLADSPKHLRDIRIKFVVLVIARMANILFHLRLTTR